MEFCPKCSWHCPEPLSLGSVAFSALPCSGWVLCALGIPTLGQGQIFPPGTAFCSKVAVISGSGRTRVRAGRCWGAHSPLPGHMAVVSWSWQQCWSSPSAVTGVPALVPALSVWQPLGCIALGYLYSLEWSYSIHAETVSWQRPAARNEVLPPSSKWKFTPYPFLCCLLIFLRQVYASP